MLDDNVEFIKTSKPQNELQRWMVIVDWITQSWGKQVV